MIKAVVLPLKGEGVLRPGAFNDLKGLGEPIPTLGIGHAIGLIGAWESTAPDAKNQAPRLIWSTVADSSASRRG